MTTIAYRDGVMAADSLGTYGDCRVPGPTTKLFRLSNGAVAGVNGSVATARQTIDWLNGERGDEQPSGGHDRDSSVVVSTFPGLVRVYEDGHNFIEEAPYMAYGSGQAVALGALHCGASAEEAIEAAIAVHIRSGGPVQTMRPIKRP